MMKEAYIMCIMFLFAMAASAQQELLHTQFMHNKLAINAGFAGHEEPTTFIASYRKQWAGFPGAPESGLLSVSVPISKYNVGVGLNISNASIGISDQLTIEGLYAYHLQTDQGKFGLGLSTSFRNYSKDFTDPRLFTIHDLSLDAAIDPIKTNTTAINFGLGAYYEGNHFYAGFSAPRLIKSDIDEDDYLRDGNEIRHLYIMGGVTIPAGGQLEFKPQVLARVPEKGPLDIDLNIGLTYLKKYTAGFTIRTGGQSGKIAESVDLMIALKLMENLDLGFAYDLSFSDLRKYHDGSLEITFSYRLKSKENPEVSELPEN